MSLPSLPNQVPNLGEPSSLPEFVGCEAAEEFHKWASSRFGELDQADPIAVNQEILLLAVKYHEWYQQLPERHQTRVGKRGHQCIFHVFMHFMDLLADARIRADPPVYFPPPSPPKAPTFAEKGTLLGLAWEMEDNESKKEDTSL